MDNAASCLYDSESASLDQMAPSADFEVNFRGMDINPNFHVFKSASVLDAGAVSGSHLFSDQDTVTEGVSSFMMKESPKYDPSSLFCDSLGSIEISTTQVYVPHPPIAMLTTSFICPLKTADEIVSVISELFFANDVSFEFIAHCAEFNAVYVNGPVYTKFQVNLYAENGNVVGEEKCDKIVEAHRLGGDGFAFNNIFGDIRSALLNEDLACTTPGSFSSCSPRSATSNGKLTRSFSMSSSNSLPIDDEFTAALMQPLSDEEKVMYLDPVQRMTLPTATIESQEEGCRLLCDMAVSSTNFHEQLLQAGFVEVLIRHSMTSNLIIAQHAMFALVALCSTQQCLEEMWKITYEKKEFSGFIEFLSKQEEDGPYYSAAMRRQALQLLSNLLAFAAGKKIVTDEKENCEK